MLDRFDQLALPFFQLRRKAVFLHRTKTILLLLLSDAELLEAEERSMGDERTLLVDSKGRNGEQRECRCLLECIAIVHRWTGED